MLFFAAVLNYIDRQALSILAPTIQKDLNLTDAQYGDLVNLFLIAYTASLLLSGRLVDKIGVRLSMALFVGWWSVANMCTAAARGFASLGVCRFALGLGEAGNWPGSTKAVSEWFPRAERALAIGIYTMGATLGATIAPILILELQGRFHWQAAFVVTGALGLLWVVPWLWIYRPPGKHPWIAPQERDLLAADAAREAAESPASIDPQVTRAGPWRTAATNPHVWTLMLARLITDPVWFFFQFWFAKYLFAQHHVKQEELGITWMVYLAADIGAVLGGIASGFLIKRGRTSATARLAVMLACALAMPSLLLVARLESVWAIIALGMVATFAHLAWLSNISALVVDLMPRQIVATCFGIVAAGSAVGGILMNKVVVYLVEHHSYHDWFTIMAFLHPSAWVLLVLSRSVFVRRKGTTS